MDLWLLLDLDFDDLPFVGVEVGDGDVALTILPFVGVAVGDGALVGSKDGDGDDEVV